MAMSSATMASSLRCCPSAGALFRRPVGTRPGPDRVSAGLLRCSKRGNGVVGLRLSCAAASPASGCSEALPPYPAPGSYTLPGSPWWAENLSEEDATYFSLADSDPPGKGREEMDAIWHALVSGPLEPVFRVLREIGAAGNLFRCRSFHIGILSGALLVIAGFSQLCNMTPFLFVDIVLGYMFYKLSILAAELQRNGRANNICARIQLVLLFVLSFKDSRGYQGTYGVLAGLIWFLNVQLYFRTVYYEMVGTNYIRIFWLGVYRILQSKGGLIKVAKGLIMYGCKWKKEN
uniref:Uncharacterized protein n=1 Tax=Oryza rufipogon TaxID=4529 RepID=A0A0E0PER3_ORYRU